MYVEMLVIGLGGLEKARLYRDKGLITLPFELFAAMKVAKAKMGIEYGDRKDTMHFEVPLDIQKELSVRERPASVTFVREGPGSSWHRFRLMRGLLKGSYT